MNPNFHIEQICTDDFKEIQRCQLDIFSTLSHNLEKTGIPYWLGYGTLIGALRHGGFIPWDDDMDICIPYSCKNILLDLEMDLDITFSEVDERLYRVHVKGGTYSSGQIDIFILDENHVEDFGRFSELMESEIYPLKRSSFNGIDCFIPNDPYNWFKRKYGGKDPLKTCLLWNHSINCYWDDGFEIFKYEFDYDKLEDRWKRYIV